jgi:hypothetical protein
MQINLWKLNKLNRKLNKWRKMIKTKLSMKLGYQLQDNFAHKIKINHV